MEIRGGPDISMRAFLKNFMEDLIVEWGFKMTKVTLWRKNSHTNCENTEEES